jgi:hypothetical protein
MKPAADGREPSSDPATRLALEHLAESRQRLAGWTAQMASRRSEGFGFGSFQPRSKTLQMLMSLALPRLPWMRWGFALLPLLLRFWRRR